jgi:RHS repeat-associated protein
MTRSSETTSFGYDNADRLTSVMEPGGSTITFAYDTEGNPIRATFPAGPSSVSTCAYYDAADRLRTIYSRAGTECLPANQEPTASDQADITWFRYDRTIDDPDPTKSDEYRLDTGLVQSVAGKAGDITTYSYDFVSRLTQARNMVGSTQQWGYQYAYDANSNRCAMRALTSTLPSAPTCLSSADAQTTTYTVNAADELTAVTTAGGTTNNTYDANGNLVNGARWAYNAQDQAKSYQPPGQSPINMTYTGSGQFNRASAGGTSFTNDALGLGRDVSGGTTTNYTRAPDGSILGFRRGGNRYYYLLDGIGSVAAVVKDDGATVATYEYAPFGELRNSTGTLTNPYRWLGSLGVYADDGTTGLYKMGTRWYDPAIGRFTQPDPIAGGSPNAYDYAGQSPCNAIDTSGTQRVDVCGTGLPTYSHARRAGTFSRFWFVNVTFVFTFTPTEYPIRWEFGLAWGGRRSLTGGDRKVGTGAQTHVFSADHLLFGFRVKVTFRIKFPGDSELRGYLPPLRSQAEFVRPAHFS